MLRIHTDRRIHTLRRHRSIPASQVSGTWELCGLGLPCPRPADVVARCSDRHVCTEFERTDALACVAWLLDMQRFRAHCQVWFLLVRFWSFVRSATSHTVSWIGPTGTRMGGGHIQAETTLTQTHSQRQAYAHKQDRLTHHDL